jgi:hypothetical protein
MIINVNLHSGKQQLRVYEGDDPAFLANRFCDDHEIYDEEKRAKLTNIVTQQVLDHRKELRPVEVPPMKQEYVPAPKVVKKPVLKSQTPFFRPQKPIQEYARIETPQNISPRHGWTYQTLIPKSAPQEAYY